MEKYQNMLTHLKQLEDDCNKFYVKGNKAAGTRLRKQLQALKELAQNMRIEIQEIKNKDA